MNFITRSIAASALTLAIAAPAAAAINVKELRQDIRRAAGPNSNVSVVVKGDTITVYGFVEDRLNWSRIDRIARATGSKDVRNSVVRRN